MFIALFRENGIRFIIRELRARPVIVGLLLGMGLITGLLESLGVALIFPLIIVIAKPEAIYEHKEIAEILDAVGIETTTSLIISLIVAIAVLTLLKNGYLAFFHFFQARVLASWKARLTGRMMRLYLCGDFNLYIAKGSSEMVRNLVSASLVFDQFIVPLINIAVNVMIGAGLFFVLGLALPEKTFLGSAVILSMSAFLYLVMKNKFKRVGVDTNKYYLQRQQIWQQSIGSIKEAKILGKEQYFVKKYIELEGNYYWQQGRYNFLAIIPVLAVETTIIFCILAMLAQIIFFTNDGADALATIGLMVIVFFRMAPILNKVLNNMQILHVGRDSVNIVAEELEREKFLPEQLTEKIDTKIGPWEILSFRNISFKYNDELVALENIDLDIKANQFIGITGESGAGKSTFLLLLLGLLRPTEGEIYVDGQSTDDPVTLRKWQNAIGFVPQSLFLLDAPLINNIAYCEEDEDIDQDRINEVLDIASLKNYVSQRAAGVSSPLGEQGSLLSGGEKQRVAIARALYRDPDVIIFDEATSALDVNTEDEIMTSLRKYKHKKTLFIISHSLSTIKNCDQIILMKEGRVIGFDTYERLLATSSEFRSLYELSDVGTKR